MAKEPITLATPIQYAKGVGAARAAELVSLWIRTCGDLLFHYPRDYLRFTEEAPVTQIQAGDMATIRGTILQTRMLPRKPKRFEALLEDASGTEGGRCVLMWFNPYDLPKKLLPGMHVRVTGKVTLFRNRLQIVQGKWEALSEEEVEADAVKGARIEPVYRATTALPSQQIGRIVGNVLEELIPQVPEWFSAEFLKERGLVSRREALRWIHRPQTLQESITAKRTLAYHEFFLHQAALAIRRYHARNSSQAIPLRVDAAVDRRIRALLPFDLTPAQNRVIESIRKDLSGTKPMNRLLQGDVGSGKTVVALYAMLAATATRRNGGAMGGGTEKLEDAASSLPGPQPFNGHQAALMAPTEILAEQHFITLTNLLAGKKVKIGLLTGSVTGRERQEVLARLADGSLGLIVGTHSLLSEEVRFRSLAMIVIDEQHKFGVEQRSRIRTKPAAEGADGGGGMAPHMLVMTATPIPRTLAMTAFGDLDVSVIDELPPGRQTIFTRMTASSSREEVYEWVAKKLGPPHKEQVYIVVPAVDDAIPDSEFEPIVPTDDPEEAPATPRPPPPPLRNAVALHRELQSGPLKDFRVGMIHGRMNRETRQHIMERFRQGLIDVLVATTVIEVGVDVPNASIMIVENADRFGLSQLHQLRGRVGRGARQSYCVLLADLTTDDSIKRLQAMTKHSSGFKIAEEDLRLRGMGHLIGTARSGRTDLHFAELLFDPQLLPMSRRDAFNIIAADPRLLDASHGEMRAAILDRFADSISLADVG